jgi:hypothetical protein
MMMPHQQQDQQAEEAPVAGIGSASIAATRRELPSEKEQERVQHDRVNAFSGDSNSKKKKQSPSPSCSPDRQQALGSEKKKEKQCQKQQQGKNNRKEDFEEDSNNESNFSQRQPQHDPNDGGGDSRGPSTIRGSLLLLPEATATRTSCSRGPGDEIVASAITLVPQNKKEIANPDPPDVLFGRGKPYQSHGGNRRLREVVNRYKANYVASRRYDKHAIAEEIVKGIQGGRWGDSGRFLRRADDGEDYWIQATDGEAREKVSHALRGKKKKIVSTSSLASSRAAEQGSVVSQHQLLAQFQNQIGMKEEPKGRRGNAAEDNIILQQMAAAEHQHRDRTALAHQLLLVGGRTGVDEMKRRMMEQQQRNLLWWLSAQQHQRQQHQRQQQMLGSPLQALHASTFLGGTIPPPPNTTIPSSSSLSSNQDQQHQALRSSSFLAGRVGLLGRTNFTGASPLLTHHQRQRQPQQPQQQQYQSNQEQLASISQSLQQQQIMHQTEQFLLGRRGQSHFAGPSSLDSAFLSSSLLEQTRANSSSSSSNPASLANTTIQQPGAPRQAQGGCAASSLIEYL